MEPAMFSVASMFGSESGDDEDDAFVERDHTFPGLVLRIREFAFHQVNANLLWPGSSIFAKWIVEHQELVKGRRVLELGSGTGGLAIFLKKTLQLDITTSDYDDLEIENNIRSNCSLNGLSTLPHIRHTWGEDFPYANPNWDLIIASDILLYVNQYSNLIRTLCFLLKGYNLQSEGSQTALATEPYRTDTQHQRPSSSIGEMQNPDSLGTISFCGAAADRSYADDCPTVPNTQAPTWPYADDCQPGGDTQAPTFMKLQGCCLPSPCFLMSWHRRIPKETDALFFEGCRTAGFVVIECGPRIYCIYWPA